MDNPLCNITYFFVYPIHSVYTCTEFVFIWVQPSEIKNTKPFEDNQQEIKKWKPTDCPRRMCKIFVLNFNFT